MNWARFAIEKRYTVIALSLAVLVFGLMAWMSLPVALFPDTAPPLVNIITPYPGAAAVDVAEDLSEPIEEEIAALDGIARVSSKSQDGLSVVRAEFGYDRDVDLVAVDVQNAISRIRGALPAATGEPRVLKFSTSDKPVVTLAVRSTGERIELGEVRRLAEEELEPLLQRTEGVASVDVFGGARAQINVLVDRDRLDAAGLGLSDLAAAIREGNVSAPGGRIDQSGRELLLRFDETVTTVDDLARLPVAETAGQRVLLGDVARLEHGAADRRSSYRFGGTEAVALQVLQRQDANTVEVVERVAGLLPDLNARYPELTIEVATEEASFTNVVVDNMGSSILSALLLASLVIFLFIGSIRGALIVSISMPMSFLLTLALMKMTGMELNLVTLSAVILAVGIVVDASVVVLENIARHRMDDAGRSMDETAAAGTQEVFFAVLAGLLTTLIVLVPFLFLSGFVGKVFGPLATTMMFAFSSSLLAAVTLIPLLAALIMGKERKWEKLFARRATGWFDRVMSRVRDGYVTLLRFGLNHRLITLGGVGLLLLVSVALLAVRGMEVLPRLDSGSFFVSLETEPGASFDETLRIVERIESMLGAEEHVVNYTAQVGFEPDASYLGDAGAMGVQQAFFTVELVSRKERPETIWDVEERLRSRIAAVPGIRTAVVKEMGGTAKSTTAAPLTVRLSGPDLDVLDDLAADASDRMGGVPGAVNVYREWTMDRPEVRLAIDRLQTARYGLTPSRLASETYAAVEGLPVTELDAPDGTSYPIVVRYAPDRREAIEDVLALRARPGLPLDAMADPAWNLAPNLVTREGLTRTADVLGFHYDRAFSHVAGDVEEAVADMELPAGYEMTFAGETSDLAETGGQMVRSLLIALIAVYLLLVAQFKSFVHPLTVMLAVPLVLIGVAVALISAGKVVSLAVLMAFVLLIGIAVNNSIILLDFILEARRAGTARLDAVIESVSVRFRPIMMTSFSTVIGMLPLALEWALGAERFSPMAVAIIGGLTASSLLTLVIIPVFYTLVDDMATRVRSIFTDRSTTTHLP